MSKNHFLTRVNDVVVKLQVAIFEMHVFGPRTNAIKIDENQFIVHIKRFIIYCTFEYDKI